MFRWKKYGRIFNPSEVKDVWWLKEFAQAPATLLFPDFVRVYFSGRPGPDQNGQYVSYTGFVDLSRRNLSEIINISKEPVLQLGQKGAFDEFGIYPASIIKSGNRVFMYYGGWTRCESVPFNVAIGCAVSDDGGINFKRIGQGPVLSYSKDEPFVLSGPKIRIFYGKWYLFYIAGSKWIANNGKPEPVYKIRMATSSDGLHWNIENRNLIANKLESDEAQASPDVFYYNNRYHMFFCYRHSLGFRSKEKGYRIGYAVSNDLVNWTRNDALAGIDVGTDGWDSEMVSYPHVFELDGKVIMFYLGNQVGKNGFGMAILEKKITENEMEKTGKNF